MKIFICGLIASWLLLGCTNQPQQNSEARISAALEQLDMELSEQPVRIHDYQVNGWRYIDRYHLIILARPDEQYLVSLLTPCYPMQTAFSIGFTSTLGTLDKYEDIIVRDSFGEVERCAIRSIVKLQKTGRLLPAEE